MNIREGVATVNFKYVDTSKFPRDKRIIEGEFQERFANFLMEEGSGWSIAKRFYKVAYSNRITNPEAFIDNDTLIPISVAKHYILENENLPRTKLGIAIVGSFAPRLGDLTRDRRPVNGFFKEEGKDYEESAFMQYVKGHISKLETQPEDEFPKSTRFFSTAEIYFYIVERVPQYVDDGEWVEFPFKSDELLRACLDVEVWKGHWVNYSGSNRFVLVEPEVNNLQSPIIKCTLRYNKTPLEDMWSEEYLVEQADTNWWYDSEITFEGVVADKGFFLMATADNAPAWEDNVVPTIPIYFGPIDKMEEDDTAEEDLVTFFAGTLPSGNINDVPKFDFDDYSKSQFVEQIMPITKSYPRHPSNGVDTVMVHRGKRGSRYQAHYLSWNTTSDEIKPDRAERHETDFTGDNFDRKYPRAWNHYRGEAYAYLFNPSRYTDVLHVSKIYVVHPEEGVRGTLRYSIGMSPVSLNPGTRIRLLKEVCDPVTKKPSYDIYRYHVADGVSPITKRPGTRYTPMGIGLLQELGGGE